MAAVGQVVVGRLKADFIPGGDVEIDGNMEGVGVILAVGDAGNFPKFLRVQTNEAAGKAFGGRGDQGEVEAVFLGGLIHTLTHIADNLQAEILRLAAFAVVDADERLEAFSQTDEAHREGAVL